MISRRNSTPINIPAPVRSGDPLSAQWANRVRDALRILRDRVAEFPPPKRTRIKNHPFKLLVSGNSTATTLKVAYGSVFRQAWANDSVGNPNITTVTSIPSFGGGILVGNPNGGTVGTAALSNGTTYGVWIAATNDGDGQYSRPAFGVGAGTPEWVTHEAQYMLELGSQVITDTTYTDPDDGPNITGANAGTGYIYIGKVAVASNRTYTVSQYLRSDVSLPWATFPEIIKSQDAANDITLGSDGGLFYEEPDLSEFRETGTQ